MRNEDIFTFKFLLNERCPPSEKHFAEFVIFQIYETDYDMQFPYYIFHNKVSLLNLLVFM